MSFLGDDILKGTDWRALERSVARLMSHCGWKQVTPIGRTGDKGADILAVRHTKGAPNPRSWVVQVKAVTGGNYVGVTAISEAISALSCYGAQSAVVATNGEFTRSAEMRRDELQKAGYDLHLWNGHFLRQLLSKWPLQHPERKALRPYQTNIVDQILARACSGTTRAHFIMATGLGKTVVVAETIRRLFDANNQTALVLCHSQDLAAQLERAFWPHLTSQERTSLFQAGEPPRRAQGVTFGLYQTMLGYLSGIDPKQYDIIVIDEAHHALAAGFLACINHMTPRLLLGMTATPWRGDGDSIDRIFGAPIARLSLVDGMAMGYLAKVDYRIFCDNINWAEVKILSSKNLSIRDLNKRLFLPQRDDATIHEIAKAIETVRSPRVVVYSPSVTHSQHFASSLTAAGIPARNVSGVDRLVRERALMDFAAGRLSALVAVDVLNEGIDLPDANIIVFMRATHSRRIFVQQLGRGLRLAEGKDKVLVLDFVSDIRRLAEVSRMDHEARNSTLSQESLYLRNGFVQFQNADVRSFVDEWLNDVADVSEENESHELNFPVLL